MISNRFLSIITARGGSKGIPRKNIIDLNGKPLIVWSIEASLKSKFINKTIVSSDDEEILSISKTNGAEVIKRAKELAEDTTSSELVILDVIEQLEKKNEIFEYFILLQPTSPLRTYEDIDSSINLFLKSNVDSLISVYIPEQSPFKSFIQKDDGYLTYLFDNYANISRRQDLQHVYMPNGAIYIMNIKKFKETKKLVTNKTLPFVMPEQRSIDIDTNFDLEIASFIMGKKR